MNSKLLETFQSSVKSQIAGDRNHGWGISDSMGVIEDCIAEWDKLKDKERLEANSDLLKLIEAVVNPSQFRQKLEGMTMQDGKTTVLAKNDKAKREKSIFELYTKA